MTRTPNDKHRSRKPFRRTSQVIQIEAVPVYLSKEENDERIERLTQKILRILCDMGEIDGVSSNTGDPPYDIFGNSSFEDQLKI